MSVLNFKYTNEKIKAALVEWEYAKNSEPEERSIQSRITMPLTRLICSCKGDTTNNRKCTLCDMLNGKVKNDKNTSGRIFDENIDSYTHNILIENGNNENNNDVGLKRAMGTTVLIDKKYSILNVLKFPSHYYIEVNGKTWHPGYTSVLNIFSVEDRHHDSKIVAFTEMCDYCIYWNLHTRFENDKNFNIFYNNCQLIGGHYTESILLISFYIFICLSIFTGNYICLLLAFAIFIIMFIYCRISVVAPNGLMPISYCKHIKL